jgi:hypothetical protein
MTLGSFCMCVLMFLQTRWRDETHRYPISRNGCSDATMMARMHPYPGPWRAQPDTLVIIES